MLKHSEYRLCLFQYKIFLGENIFGKRKYFLVFGCILKNALENTFLSGFSHFPRSKQILFQKISIYKHKETKKSEQKKIGPLPQTEHQL